MAECKGLFGRLFGHSYKARYTMALPVNLKNLDVTPLHYHGSDSLETILSAQADAQVRFISALKGRIYNGDVCSRCGDIINTSKEVPHG